MVDKICQYLKIMVGENLHQDSGIPELKQNKNFQNNLDTSKSPYHLTYKLKML